jgi:DnaJ like chaperone protein
MALQGKLIGAGIGWFLGGPLGAVLGAMVGHVFADGPSSSGVPRIDGAPQQDPRITQQQQELHFVASLVGILTAMMRADGDVRPEEVRAIRGFFRERLGYRGESEQIVRELIKRFLNNGVDLDALCRDVARLADYPTRLLLMGCLFDIAMADGHFHPQEQAVFERVANLLGIAAEDLPRSAASQGADSDFEVLGVKSSASREEVRSAYRTLVKKYHPDRVQHLGKEFYELAQHKFIAIQTSYERICASRGWP